MRTVGIILKEERLKRGLTISEVEQAIKIRKKYLEALEHDDFKNLPSLTYAQGFLKNYTHFLGLKIQIMMAIFRRQYQEQERLSKATIEEPIENRRFQITPNKVIILFVITLIIILFGYFYAQYKALHEPPPLSLEAPANDIVVSVPEIAMYGVTDTDATILINSEPILVKEDGRFYKDVQLATGINSITIEAISRVGEKTVLTRTVTRTPN